MTESFSPAKFKSFWKYLFPTRNNNSSRVLVTLNNVPQTPRVSSPSVPLAQALHSQPRAERALDVALPTLGFVAAASDAVPIAGGPLKGVVNAMLEILKAFDQTRRNREDIAILRSRLNRLNDMISAMIARGCDPPRHVLRGQLFETEIKLRVALSLPKIRFKRVAQLIKECCDDINNYLQEYMLETMMHLCDTQLSWSIFLVDDLGNKHQISMGVTRTLEQFKRAIRMLYIPNSDRDIMHQHFLDTLVCDLCVDTGKHILDLETDEDIHELVRPGTTVTMCIMSEGRWSDQHEYLCFAHVVDCSINPDRRVCIEEEQRFYTSRTGERRKTHMTQLDIPLHAKRDDRVIEFRTPVFLCTAACRPES